MRFERLDLNLLVALDALIEDRNVSMAARRLYLSQPALTGALNRLRDFFGDDLLIPSGRQMMLTPKAEELRGPVREALMLIRTRITTPVAFDPASAERHFTIVASDYAYHVLVAGVMQAAATLAPGITFELVPTDRRAAERLERGEVDLFLTISTYMLEGHPRRPMYKDEHAVIRWSGADYGRELTAEAFLAAHHAVAYFGAERHPAFTETYFSQQGIARKIDVRVPIFSALPHAVINTQRLATMYRRHAEYFARFLPLTVHEPPVFLPTVTEEAQWHTLRHADEGLKWLLELFTTHARRLSPDLTAEPSTETADSTH